jgi:hypothetical protein
MPNNSSPFYLELAEALKNRLEVISNQELRKTNPEEHLQQIKTASLQIMALHAKLPVDAHPQLAHYLERCSYDKALAHVEAMN